METRSGKILKAKVNVEPAPKPLKPKSSKIQKADWSEQTEGVRKSVKQKGRTRKAKGAGAGKRTVKKKAQNGLKDETVLESIEDPGADAIVDLTTVPQPSGSSIRRGSRSEPTRNSAEQAALDLRAYMAIAEVADEVRKAEAADRTIEDTTVRNDEPASTHGALEGPAVGADHPDNGVDRPVGSPHSDPFGEITREALRLVGWDTAPIEDKALRACCVEQLSRLPSPLAGLGKRDAELDVLIATCVHSGVVHSYERFKRDSVFLNQELRSDSALSDDGAIGIFCALATRNAASKGKGRVKGKRKGKGKFKAGDSGGSSMDIYRLDSAMDEIRIPIVDLNAAQPEMPDLKWQLRTNMHLPIHRLSNTEKGGEVGYFIINNDIELLALNESAIGTGMIAGPLPEFALITIGHLVGLWWSTTQALNYVSPRQGQTRKRDTCEDGDGQHTGTSAATTKLRNLKDQLSRYWINQAETLSRLSDKERRNFSTEIKKKADMSNDDIAIGIGTIWETLRNLNRLYAHGSLDVFDPGSNGEPGVFQSVGIVGRRRPFIMPLLFESRSQQKARGKSTGYANVGHLILAVAEIEQHQDFGERYGSANIEGDGASSTNGLDKTANKSKDQEEGKPLLVNLSIYDSLPGHVAEKDVIQRTQTVVEESGWLGVDKPKPEFSAFKPMIVPVQTSGSNTCGFHVILNAWAVMLNIPIHPDGERRSSTDDDSFYEDGLRMMNLALAGFMDLATIQEYMDIHGYSQDEGASVPRSTIGHVKTVRLDQPGFQACLRLQHETEKIADFRGNIPEDIRAWYGDGAIPSDVTDERLRDLYILTDQKPDEARSRLWPSSPQPSTSPPPDIREPMASHRPSITNGPSSMNQTQGTDNESHAAAPPSASIEETTELPSPPKRPKRKTNSETPPKTQRENSQSSGLSSPKSSPSSKFTKRSSAGRPARTSKTDATAPSRPSHFGGAGEPYAWRKHPRWPGPPESP